MGSNRVEVIGKSMTEVFEDRLDNAVSKVEVDGEGAKEVSGYSFVLPCGH